MYAKVFSQIFDSTIADHWQYRHIFMDLLVLCDQDGNIDMPVSAIARRTNVPLEMINEAIAFLESPDPQSRTPDFEGRRLLRHAGKEWGWMIANYPKYRAIASEEQRREKTRERVNRFREAGGGAPDRWPSIRVKILKLDKYICGYCEKPANSVDHIKPQSKGGDESDLNLTACCLDCNSRKNNRTPEEAGMKLYKNHRVTHRVTPDAPCNAMQTQLQLQKQKEMQKEKEHMPSIEGLAATVYDLYPKKVGRPKAIQAIVKALGKHGFKDIQTAVTQFAAEWENTSSEEKTFCPMPATWFNQERYKDDPETWKRRSASKRAEPNQIEEYIEIPRL